MNERIFFAFIRFHQHFTRMFFMRTCFFTKMQLEKSCRKDFRLKNLSLRQRFDSFVYDESVLQFQEGIFAIFKILTSECPFVLLHILVRVGPFSCEKNIRIKIGFSKTFYYISGKFSLIQLKTYLNKNEKYADLLIIKKSL